MSEFLKESLPDKFLPAVSMVLNQIAEGFCAVDADWRIRYMNPRGAEIFEGKREDWVGKTIWDAFPVTTENRARVEITRVPETQAPTSFEFYLERSKRWLAVRVYPGADGVYIYFEDVTAKKTDGMAAKWLATVMESLHEGIITLNPEREIISWNPAAEQIFGYYAEEVLGRNVRMLTFPELEKEQSEQLEKLERGEAIVNYETMRRTKSGSAIDVALTMAPLRDESEAMVGLTATVHDITEQKQALLHLRQSHNQLNEILDTIHDAYLAVDADWRLTYVNGRMEQLTELARHELLGKNLWALLPHAVGSWQYKEMQRAMRERVPVKFEQYSTFFKGWYEINVYPSRDHLVAYFRDISERKKAEATQVYFRTLFESAPGAYLVLEPNEFEIVAVSNAYLETTRVTREQILGKRLFDIFRDDTDDAVGASAKLMRRSLERVKQTLRAEVMGAGRYDTPVTPGSTERQERWWSPLNAPVMGPSGELSLIVHRVEDVTPFLQAKRKRGEEQEAFDLLETRTQHMEADTVLRAQELQQLNVKLRASQEKLERALDAAQMGTWGLDLQRRTGEIDERAAWILGEPSGTPPQPVAFGKTLERWVNPRDRGHFMECVRAAIDPTGSGRCEIQFRVNRPDAVQWVELKAQTLFDEKDPTRTALRMEGTIIDITTRREAREALEQSEERYRTLFDSIDEGFCIIEVQFDEKDTPVDYRFVEINPAFAQQSGIVDAEGKRVRDLVPTLEEHWMQIFGKVALSGEPQRYINKADGLDRWFEVYGCRVGNPQDHRVAVLFNDITARKREEAQILSAQDELERRVEERTRELAELVENRKQLLSQLVNAQEEERRRITRELHDQLGQLLTALGLGLKALHTQNHSEPSFEASIKKLEALTKLTSETVQSLAYDLRPSALDDLGLVTMLSNYLDDWAAQHGIAVHYETAGLVPERLEARLEIAIYRIVQEALTNILKHAHATSVSVILERNEARVVTIIEDNGEGFDSERVLLQKNTREAFGLTSMRERAEMIGGALEIESKPNGGTTVFIHIPLRDADRNAAK